MFELAGKTFLISGGTKGIGLGVATSLAASGARVIVTARRAVPLPGGVECRSCDQSREPAVVALFADLRAEGVTLEGLVINAGVVPEAAPLLEADGDDLQAAWCINTLGVVHFLKHSAALLRDGASVVVTATPASTLVFPDYATYGASKAGLELLVRHAAAELGARAIRVNAINPGTILTDMQPDDDAEAQICRKATCLRRPGEVEDMLGAFHFLLSDASRYVTASTLTVDGGWLGGFTADALNDLLEIQA